MAEEKIKILLVEDDSFLLSMYAAKFELENFKVVTADDGEKAVRLALKEAPDIILLDIILPKIDGFEVLRRLKDSKDTVNIPVILLTNLSQKEEIEQGRFMSLDEIDALHDQLSPTAKVILKLYRQNVKKNRP